MTVLVIAALGVIAAGIGGWVRQWQAEQRRDAATVRFDAACREHNAEMDRYSTERAELRTAVDRLAAILERVTGERTT